MATATQQTQSQSVNTPSASSSDPSSSDQDSLWEGDKMFNVYIWDYCTKRGYTNTARELAEEAKISPNPRPPIDAKQGLLYEWWAVFWVLFTAKSTNSGTDDAMVYIQNHMAMARMNQAPGANLRYQNGVRAIPGAPGPMPNVPNSLGIGAPGHPGHPNQQPNAHPMPNGIGPTPPVQHQQGQPQSQGQPPQQAPTTQQQQPQAPPPLGFPGHVQQPQQPNGIPAHGRPPMTGQGQPGSGPGPGPGQPQRGQMPFSYSPTMAHQQPGATGGPPPPYPGPGPHAGSGIPPNMYPQPHMRSMLPPGAPNGVGGSPGFGQGPPGAGSRAATPAQSGGSGITNPSPSMVHRTVPATPPSFGAAGITGIPSGGRGPPFEQTNIDLQKIDPTTLNELRGELGLGNRDIATLSFDEKSRLLNTFRQRNGAGPSNQMRPQQGRGSKRNSTSPGDEHTEMPVKGEASPPAHKRVRRSPEQPAPPTPGATANTPQGGPANVNPNPMPGMYPQNMMQNGMRPGGAPFTPQMSGMTINHGPPSGMMMQPGHPGMVNAQMSQQQQQQQQQFQKSANPQGYPGNLQATHKIGTPDSQQQMQQPPFGPDPNQPRSGPPSFATNAAGMGQRSVQGRMLPPSSPASNSNANGPGKPPQGAQAKPEGPGKVENSPRSGPPPPPSGPTGPSPPTPVPGPGQLGASAPSPSLTNPSRPATATSNPVSGPTPGPAPSAPPPSASAPPGTTDTLTSGFDFMSTGFDDFTSMFGREDNNLDFDRDFGNWFSSGDLADLSK